MNLPIVGFDWQMGLLPQLIEPNAVATIADAGVHRRGQVRVITDQVDDSGLARVGVDPRNGHLTRRRDGAAAGNESKRMSPLAMGGLDSGPDWPV